MTRALLQAQSGRVDNDTLTPLKRDWGLYRGAYEAFTGNSLISVTNDVALFTGWVTQARDLWTNGIGSRVPTNVYTQATHEAIIRLAGLTPGANNDRAALLRSWVPHESSDHWGRNANHPYRMTKGSADEHGSLGFSQVLYGNRFGNTPCAAHASASLNPYHPVDSIEGLVVHSASDNFAGAGQSRCRGSFYRGFHASAQTLDANFAGDIGNIETGPGTTVAGNVNDLRGYRHSSGAITPLPGNEDDYDVLAKAIVGYNGGDAYSEQFSWAKFLKYKRYDPNVAKNNDGVCHSCRYSIEIRDDIFVGNMRTFIWHGGTYSNFH